MKNLIGEMVGKEDEWYNPNGLVEIICCKKGEDPASVDVNVKKDYLAVAQKRMMAMHFILNADMDRYGNLVD